jgi:hypothetical protein
MLTHLMYPQMIVSLNFTSAASVENRLLLKGKKSDDAFQQRGVLRPEPSISESKRLGVCLTHLDDRAAAME